MLKLEILLKDKVSKSNWKSKPYLKWIASQQCILCMYNECQAHHITIAEKRGISQKVSDFWTIPLCYAHHDQLHNFGERKYWEQLNINPMDIAIKFYELWSKDDKNNIEYIHNEIYNKVLPNIKSNVDFLMRVKY